MSVDNNDKVHIHTLSTLFCITADHVFLMRIIIRKSSGEQKWDKNTWTAYYVAGSLVLPQKEPPIL